MRRIIHVALGLTAATLPLMAQTRARAFLWNDRLTGSGPVNSGYQFNSAGGTNSVTNGPTGKYVVDLPNLAGYGGTVHVTAYGGNHYCKTDGWGPVGSSLQIGVKCFAPTGAPVNGLFTLLYYREARPDTANQNAYLWANNAAAASYTPDLTYQWNSRRSNNWISRSGPGVYTAHLPGLSSAGGTVMATAYGPGPERCKVYSWNPIGGGVDVRVLCFQPNGTPADSRFTLSFMTDVALGTAGGEQDYMGAYAWGDDAYSHCYTPWAGYQLNHIGAPITSCCSAAGSYELSLPSQPPSNKTAAFATAYGSTADYCNIGAWWQTAGGGGSTVNVKCFNRFGTQVDTQYTMQYLTSSLIPW